MDEELSEIIDLLNCGGTQKSSTLKKAICEARNTSNCISPREKLSCPNIGDREYSEQLLLQQEISENKIQGDTDSNNNIQEKNEDTKDVHRNNIIINDGWIKDNMKIEFTEFDDVLFKCDQKQTTNNIIQNVENIDERVHNNEKENTSFKKILINKDLEYELNISSQVPLVEIQQNTNQIANEENKKQVEVKMSTNNEEKNDDKIDEKLETKAAFSVIDDSYINKEVAKNLEKKYLCNRFPAARPYIDPLTVKPYVPSDRGYYFKMMNCDIKIVRFTLEDNGFREAKSNTIDWTIMWYCGSIKTQIYQGLTKYQKVNHFPRSNELTRKDLICENMNRMNSLHGDAHYDFVPKTFNLPKEHAILIEEMERDPERWWIVKPAASSQGKGIYFTKNINELPYKQNSVVSHYINNPMLINGYKYDLRIYIAVTSINPLRLYMYEEGLVRFATAKYKPLGTENFTKYTHLTNYSVNKKNANFLQNNDASQDNYGSKWSLTAFWKYCKSNGIDDSKIRRRIEDVVIKSVISGEHIMSKAFDMFVPYQK